MNGYHVWLVFEREVRDQLRDRRTMFMIVVLPLLLYPLMGMAMLQFTQFVQERPTSVWVVGAHALPDRPRLLEEGRFSTQLFDREFESQLLDVRVVDSPTGTSPPATAGADWAEKAVADGTCDAVVWFPPEFAAQLREYPNGHKAQPPAPRIIFTSAKDPSRVAYQRLRGVLDRWRTLLVEKTLEEHDVPGSATQPFQLAQHDIAETAGRVVAVWSKILPFILTIWALTGAFYPAVDACAGEKERGTLETLLCSPADRRDIVWGKLLMVMVFSGITAVLNLASMLLTGSLILSRLGPIRSAQGVLELASPPLVGLAWLMVALVPLTALFGALAMALAAMARSSKEGQYYLMPLLFGTLPLVVIPVLPATELNLGNSLIPVTGIMLLLRELMGGEYLLAAKYALPVLAVTAACCLMAIRWAENQFRDESVLFRDSERMNLGLWLVHLVRDRQETPTLAQAFICAAVLLVLCFFSMLVATLPDSWVAFAVVTSVRQLAFIAFPALLMTVLLTSSPRQTLLLRLPRPSAWVIALLLGVAMHPAAAWCTQLVQQAYPLAPRAEQQFEHLAAVISQAPHLGHMILVMALIPAICEELAFRGFVLSGLRRLGSQPMAIVISSLLFGLAHGVLQQSITACLLGLVLAYVAIQTRSLFPCIVLHLTHNGLALVASQPSASLPLLREPPAIVASVLISAVLLYWLRQLPLRRGVEQRVQQTLDNQPLQAVS